MSAMIWVASLLWAGPGFPLYQSEEDLRCLRLRAPEEIGHVAELVRRFSLTRQQGKDVESALERLNDPEYAVRLKAQEALASAPPGAIALFRQAAQGPDLHLRRALSRIELRMAPRWPAFQAEAAVRLLRLHRPPHAAKILWDYLPTAEDPQVQAEILAALRDLQEQGLTPADLFTDADAWPCQLRALPLLKLDAEAPTEQALTAARTFFRLLALEKTDELAEMCHLPFTMGGVHEAKSPGELRAALVQMSANSRKYKNFSLSMLHVRRGEVFLAHATTDEAAALKPFPPGEVRAVAIKLRYNVGEEEMGAILVWLSPQGPRILGLGQGRSR